MVRFLGLEEWVQNPMAFFWICAYLQIFVLCFFVLGWYALALASTQPAWANNWALISALAATTGLIETVHALFLYIKEDWTSA